MPYVAKLGLVGAQEHAGPQRPACCSRLAVMSQAHALTALDGQLLRKNALPQLCSERGVSSQAHGSCIGHMTNTE